MSQDSLWGPRHRSVMSALMATMAVASYNNLAVASALPDIGDELGHIKLLPWIITLELLTAAVAVLAIGPLVDGFGVRLTFRYVGIGFIATSLVVSLAPTMVSLVAARAVQGLFSGAVMTVAIAGIGISVPAKLRPKAFAAVNIVWGVTGVAGPAIAAAILVLVGWRGIFMANLPVTAFALTLGWNRLPGKQPGASVQRIDRVGLVLISLFTVGLLGLTTTTLRTVALSAGALVLSGLAYYRWAHRVENPVVRLEHLAHARYRNIHITSMAAIAAGIGANSFLPLYLRGARGTSVTVAAFSVLYLTLGWTSGGLSSSKLQDRWPGEWVSMLGAGFAVPGSVLVAATIWVDAPLAWIYAGFVWLGLGVGLVTSTGSALVQNRTDVADMGRVNGAHHFLRSVAITLGIAAVASITLAVVANRTGDVEAVRDLLSEDKVTPSPDLVQALSDGFAYALMFVVGVAAVTVPAAIRLVRNRGLHLDGPS